MRGGWPDTSPARRARGAKRALSTRFCRRWSSGALPPGRAVLANCSCSGNVFDESGAVRDWSDAEVERRDACVDGALSVFDTRDGRGALEHLSELTNLVTLLAFTHGEASRQCGGGESVVARAHRARCGR